MKSILTEEYPNMCKGMTNEEKGAYALETQKKERSLTKLLKKVRENVKLLEDCNKTKEGNSDQFNKMFAAAEKAKNLSVDMPIAEIHSIMSDIMATASIYRHKIASQGIYAGNMLVGKKKGYYRKQAANDLIDLAIEIVEPLNSFTDPYKPIGEQIKPQIPGQNQIQIQEPKAKGQGAVKDPVAKH